MRLPGGPNPIKKRYGLSLRQSIVRRYFRDQVKGDIMGRIRDADQESAKDALRIALELSSGRLSLKELARKPFPDHPYAKAHPNPIFDPSVINRQSGKFYRGWKIMETGPYSPPGIWNTSRVARFLEFGTRRMVRRPIDQAIIVLLEPIRLRNFDRAFSDGTFARRPAMPAPVLLRPAAS